MRYEPTPLKLRGQIARAMAAAYEQRKPGQDVSGRIPCTNCRGGKVSFTVFPSGISRGSCTAGCGVAWTQ